MHICFSRKKEGPALARPWRSLGRHLSGVVTVKQLINPWRSLTQHLSGAVTVKQSINPWHSLGRHLSGVVTVKQSIKRNNFQMSLSKPHASVCENRENIRLALPNKGALEAATLNFLAECGLRVSRSNPRQYLARMK